MTIMRIDLQVKMKPVVEEHISNLKMCLVAHKSREGNTLIKSALDHTKLCINYAENALSEITKLNLTEIDFELLHYKLQEDVRKQKEFVSLIMAQ